jgi:hypothetical protein
MQNRHQVYPHSTHDPCCLVVSGARGDIVCEYIRGAGEKLCMLPVLFMHPAPLRVFSRQRLQPRSHLPGQVVADRLSDAQTLLS